MIGCAISAANCSDRDGLEILCHQSQSAGKALPRKVYADLGYSGKAMKKRMETYGIELETIGRKEKKTFEVEPKRWVVERTFAWLGKYRRMSKDYELITETSKTMVYLGMSRLMLRRMSLI